MTLATVWWLQSLQIVVGSNILIKHLVGVGAERRGIKAWLKGMEHRRETTLACTKGVSIKVVQHRRDIPTGTFLFIFGVFMTYIYLRNIQLYVK